jgi:hypothetical protein
VAQLSKPASNNNINVQPTFTNADQQLAANMGMQMPVQQMQMPIQQMQMPQQMPQNFSNTNSTPMTNAQHAQVRNVSGGFYGNRMQAPINMHPPQEQIAGFFNDDEALVEKAK